MIFEEKKRNVEKNMVFRFALGGLIIKDHLWFRFCFFCEYPCFSLAVSLSNDYKAIFFTGACQLWWCVTSIRSARIGYAQAGGDGKIKEKSRRDQGDDDEEEK